jgi:multiple sugar transport system substrate-binding protein
MEYFPYKQFNQKIQIELGSGGASLDVMAIQPHVHGAMYSEAGWLEPLDSLLKNPELTHPDFDFEDFFEGTVTACTMGGNLLAMPVTAGTQVVFYRKDLFEKHGLKIPDTFDEFEEVVKKLTMDTDGDGNTDIYGFVSRGTNTSPAFYPFLRGFGGGFVDKGKVVINTPESVKALEFYVKLLREYGPPGTAAFSWEGAASVFKAGKAGIWVGANGLIKVLNDPTKSQVADKFSVAMVPQGPNGRWPYAAGWGLSIFNGSKNKEPAWYFIQWALGKKVLLDLQRPGGNYARKSVWRDDVFMKKTGKAYVDAVEGSLAIAKESYVPPIVRALEGRRVVEVAVAQAIEGSLTAKQAFDQAAKQLEAVIAR